MFAVFVFRKLSITVGFQTKVRIEKVSMAIVRRINFICLKYGEIKYTSGIKFLKTESRMQKNHN